jgi:hypothetical protein
VLLFVVRPRKSTSVRLNSLPYLSSQNAVRKIKV